MAHHPPSPELSIDTGLLSSIHAELYNTNANEIDSPVQNLSMDDSSTSRNKKPECTFHQFLRLPTELRLKIWEMTVQPRTVELHCIHRTDSAGPKHIEISSPTPPPATLHVYQESRSHLLAMYLQVPLKNGGWKCANPPMRGKRGWRKRTPKWVVIDETTQEYALLIWEIDTVCIDTCLLHCFESIAPLIKNLKIERDIMDEYWYRWESEDLRAFQQVEKILVVYPQGEQIQPRDATSDIFWPCGPENVFLMDEDQTLMLTEVRYMRLQV